eukprot:TRINITY_DN16439_c0_g1_i1.p1 TRINITY_DN16439_c0_g1~~TRINITY_DN16439_c0_g1_i1.p1  ORF type:complete len:215 (-),score=43.44 TRINITY_DN16439_c0_g1_i1:88-663(-)
MGRSLDFYVDALHFDLLFTADRWGDKRVPPAVHPRGGTALAMVRLGAAALLLQAVDEVPAAVRGAWPAGAAGPGAGISVYVLGLDPDGLVASLPPHVRVAQAPATQPSGMREAVLIDPVNGYAITVGKSVGRPGGGGGVLREEPTSTRGGTAGVSRGGGEGQGGHCCRWEARFSCGRGEGAIATTAGCNRR